MKFGLRLLASKVTNVRSKGHDSDIVPCRQNGSSFPHPLGKNNNKKLLVESMKVKFTCLFCLFISWVSNGGPRANLMAACFVNKVLLKHSHPYLFYYLSLFHTTWQNWVLPAKPETFTIRPLTEEACQSFRFRELGNKGYHEAPNTLLMDYQ